MNRFFTVAFTLLLVQNLSSGQGTIKSTPTVSSDGKPLSGIPISALKANLNAESSDSVTEIAAETGYELMENRISSSSLKQVIDGDKLNPAFQLNINNILAGKVAGLKIYGQSGMALGRTGYVSLRGPTGFSTGEGPVYYFDGTLISDINDIPYNEVESVTVLTGPASAALTGSEGRNGAVLIRTKDERNVSTGSGFVVNSGVQFSIVNMLPAYQDSYSGGGYKDLLRYEWKAGDPEEWIPLDGKYYHDYGDDLSWGPLMIGQEYIPWYAWYPGTEYTGKTAKLYPQPDNVRKFYDTGVRLNNSLNFYKKTEKVYVSGTVGHINEKGNIPYTTLNKYFFALKAKADLSPRFSFETNFNYFTTLQSGEIDDDYSNITTGDFNSWYHRDLESEKMKEFVDYRVPGTRIISSWNHGNPTIYDPGYPNGFYAGFHHDNAYTYLKTRGVTERSDRLSGKVSLKYKIDEILSTEITFRTERNYLWNEEKVPLYDYSGWQAYMGKDDFYLTGTGNFTKDYLTGLIRAEKQFSNLSIDLTAGLDMYFNNAKSNVSGTYGGLIIPELYAIENSRDKPSITNTRYESQTRSLFSRAVTGYKDLLFIDLILRREWHSTLPPDNNAINIKSIGGAFIFSKLVTIPFMDLGKIRLSWGQIPSGLRPFQYPGTNYPLRPAASYYYGDDPYAKWNGNYMTETPNTFSSENLKGSVKTELEAGIDIALFKSRFLLGFTFWNGKEEGIPVTVPISGYSGFNYKIINSGIIERQGYDIILSGSPFLSGSFEWQTTLVFSKLLKYDVVMIADGVNGIEVQPFWYSSTPSMYMGTGMQWGVLISAGMYLIDGKPLLNNDGTYVSDPNRNFGSVYPDITGGIQNEFRICKAIRINFNIDYQFGGRFFSSSQMWGTYSGLTARTAYINDKGFPVRLPVADGGGVHVFGLDKNTFKDVDYYVEAQDYFHGLVDDRIYDSFVFDASYIKLRDLSLSYCFPFDKKGVKKIISGLEIAVYAENLLMIWSAQKNFDPSELSFTDGEMAQFPSIRSFGTNIRLVF